MTADSRAGSPYANMDQLVQCPVCTLFLHNGMSLESHLDTHPKDQVIKALCSLSKTNNYGSRTPTPLNSERSYRSRSRTPATEDGNLKWSSSRSCDNERYWRRTPSRSSKPSNPSRVATPASDVLKPHVNFDNGGMSSGSFSNAQYSMKADKIPPSYAPNSTMPDFDQSYLYYQDQKEDKEIKYSRSVEYTHNPINNENNMFYNMPTMPPAIKRPRKEMVKVIPKPNNILVKTNLGGIQYIGSGSKPMHVVLPPAPSFVQKNVQNNMIMTGAVPASPLLDCKSSAPALDTNQLNQIVSGSFTPGTTVVTQNSQIIYREMVHNIDGKPFLSAMPAVVGSENVSNVSQTSSVYQNFMVVDQFGNTSCMYAPQPLLPKACTPFYNNTMTPVSSAQTDRHLPGEPNKTLVIEVSPLMPPIPSTSSGTTVKETNSTVKSKIDKENRTDTPTTCKGLKILSNIKVEVPVQHNKNMLNTVMDLTGCNDSEYRVRPLSPEKILPDLEMNSPSISNESPMPHSSANSPVPHAFSVIKNVGNPPSYKDSIKSLDNKIENDFSDSCPVPDLICNEKPSISPCSELSEHGDNSTDRAPLSPRPDLSPKCDVSRKSLLAKSDLPQPPPLSPKPELTLKPSASSKVDSRILLQGSHSAQNSDLTDLKVKTGLKSYSNPLRLNNIYVKKNKKILQIKNAKPIASQSSTGTEPEAIPSSSTRPPEDFTMNKLHQDKEKEKNKDTSSLHTVSIEEIKSNDLREIDADTEVQSMDIEPSPPSNVNSAGFSTSVDIVQVKEEIVTSNEGGFSNEAATSDRHLTPLETLRPINVITYGNMPAADLDEESNHRELLDLEAASKSKQFVNMMNDNYFGDNIYADYFTPDRVESFDDRELPHHASGKDGMYFWGEPSQKDNAEFVLPNFIHESYKIAESNYLDIGDGPDACERDSKADVLSESRSDGEPPLNICADEKMPPRGELSGQESNGDMDSSWNGIYQDAPPSEPYDLMARESWVSDGSDVDATEKRETLEEEIQYPKRSHTCSQCGAKFPSVKELRSHKLLAHAAPTSSKTTYSRMVTARTIKKEEKTDENVLPGTILAMDNKETLANTMLNVYDVMAEAKPKIETLIKQEPTKKRRRDYVCPMCKVDQLTEAGWTAHLKLHPLECLTCGRCFARRANLALHLKTHYGIKNYKCDVCEKRFLTRQKLVEHHNIHTGRAPIKCTMCDHTFRRYSNMVQHRDRHHLQKKSKVRDFICHCGAVFHSKAKLLWHKEIHDEKPKACLYCSEKFVHSASLTRHVRRSHNEYYVSEQNKGKVQNVTCPVCKQVYLRSNLRAHLQTHSGKRPYVCIICNKSFTTKWNLKLHKWTHMSRSSKPFKCSLCKGAFIRQTEYISHMNAHKAVRPYTCNYCGCQFIRKYNCQRHVREHEMAKKYVCKVQECGKSFHRSYYLTEHMKVHSGARPFSCSICGKTSSNKSNHNKHLKIHHAREPVATEA